MLTPKQLLILRYLAIGGWSNQRICEELRITLACFYVHCQHLRERTGIADLKDPRQCKKWLEAHPEARKRAHLPTVPTRRQFEILQAFADGKDYNQIATEMHLSRRTVLSQMSAARLRAGITGSPFADRREQVREYLSRASGKVTMADPMFQ